MMISYQEALSRIKTLKINTSSKQTPLAECLNQVLATDVYASDSSPRFDNSAMDGIACRSDDVISGARLKVLETQLAGDEQHRDSWTPGSGTAIRVMTGAAVPQCYDSVVPVEQIELQADGTAIIGNGAEPHRHIRRAGEDIQKGDRLWTKGHCITPETIMIAANFGMTHLPVQTYPRVVVISTGNEIRELGEPLSSSSIYNSSKYFLESALRDSGFTDITCLQVRDDHQDAHDKINDYLVDADTPTLFISTGAVSMGVTDFIPDFIKKSGFEVLFHKVKIRPGKPVLVAQKRNLIWLGLPGNPISTAVGWHFFAKPIIRTIMDSPERSPVFTETSSSMKKPPGLTCFYRAAVKDEKSTLLNGQGSAQFLASTQANAYIVLPEEPDSVEAGKRVETYYL